MGLVVPQGRERMMGYGPLRRRRQHFEQYGRRLSARPAALRAREIDYALAAEQAKLSASPAQRDELNALDFDTSRHYPRLPLFHGREVD
jgi:hypothetical protein